MIELAASTDRRVPVWAEALRRHFPPPVTFDHLDMKDRSQEGIDAWVEALRFRREAIVVGSVCGHYVDVDGWLPCGVLLRALATFFCMQPFCTDDEDLPWGRYGSLAEARRLFMVSALSGLSRWKSSVGVPKELGMDVTRYRTRGEDEYMRRLTALDPSLVASWAGRIDIDDRALCFERPQFCVDFRYLAKGSLHFESNFVRNMRQTRADTGYTVTNQNVTQNNIFNVGGSAAYAKRTIDWSRIKVPIGCCKEFPLESSYKGSALTDPRSGYWVVGYADIMSAESVVCTLTTRFEPRARLSFIVRGSRTYDALNCARARY